MARISENQKNLMADFFINNPKLIENKFSDSFTFEIGEKLWDELSELLNASGKAQKDPKKWKKTWDDLKRTVKDKAALIKRESLKTGNQPASIVLSPLEEKFASIIGEILINGDPEIVEMGFDKNNQNLNSEFCVKNQSAVNSNPTETECIEENIIDKETSKSGKPKIKGSRSHTDAFGNGSYEEMVKHQKTLAEATMNQANQLQSIAIAMEERNEIERQRNLILNKKYECETLSTDKDYEEVTVNDLNNLM